MSKLFVLFRTLSFGDDSSSSDASNGNGHRSDRTSPFGTGGEPKRPRKEASTSLAKFRRLFLRGEEETVIRFGLDLGAAVRAADTKVAEAHTRTGNGECKSCGTLKLAPESSFEFRRASS